MVTRGKVEAKRRHKRWPTGTKIQLGVHSHVPQHGTTIITGRKENSEYLQHKEMFPMLNELTTMIGIVYTVYI